MRRIKTTLPLLTCLIHGQMRPPLALSLKEKRGIFPKLKVRMEQLLLNPDLDGIDKWYMESLPQFTNLEIEDEDNNPASDALLKLLDDSDGSYSPTSIADTLPIMNIEINVPNGFAELFYDVALRLETIRTLLWLRNEEGQLRNDEAMLQVVRGIMTRLNEFSHECVLRQNNSTDKCNDIIKLRIMQLYFAIEHTYCKRDEWRDYLEEVCRLPLNLDEYCYQLWEGTPKESWRDAYDNLSSIKAKVKAPNPQQLTEEQKETIVPTGAEAEANEIIIKYDHFVEVVKTYNFFDCPAVTCLNEKQRGQLVRSIVNRRDNYGAYAIAMLCELNYDKWMMDNFAKANPYTKRGLTKTAIHKHWKDALSLTSLRAVAGNYNVIRNPNGKEDMTIYKASEYTIRVHEDYMSIKG